MVTQIVRLWGNPIILVQFLQLIKNDVWNEAIAIMKTLTTMQNRLVYIVQAKYDPFAEAHRHRQNT